MRAHLLLIVGLLLCFTAHEASAAAQCGNGLQEESEACEVGAVLLALVATLDVDVGGRGSGVGVEVLEEGVGGPGGGGGGGGRHPLAQVTILVQGHFGAFFGQI